jgi:hypothetical protein
MILSLRHTFRRPMRWQRFPLFDTHPSEEPGTASPHPQYLRIRTGPRASFFFMGIRDEDG